jgi:hypothetical protein
MHQAIESGGLLLDFGRNIAHILIMVNARWWLLDVLSLGFELVAIIVLLTPSLSTHNSSLCWEGDR